MLKQLAALALVMVGACCSAERTAGPEPERRNEVVTEPHGPVAIRIDPATLDCNVVPQRECCQAMTTQCIRCGDEAAAEADAWAAKCNDAAEPVLSFDCSKPAPVRPCCRAMLPKCTTCASNNRAIEEAYRAQCVAAPR